jgi:hypothetical protein
MIFIGLRKFLYFILGKLIVPLINFFLQRYDEFFDQNSKKQRKNVIILSLKWNFIGHIAAND